METKQAVTFFFRILKIALIISFLFILFDFYCEMHNPNKKVFEQHETKLQEIEQHSKAISIKTRNEVENGRKTIREEVENQSLQNTVGDLNNIILSTLTFF